MMGFIAKKILGLSYGIAACAMISCSVFGADLSEDDSRLNRLEQLVHSYPPHFPHLVTAHEADITNHTTRIDSHETHIQAIQALTTRFETQITELTTQFQTLSARFELLERNARPPAPPIVAAIANPVPAIARGSEAIYERFLRGKLIYRPTAGSDVGKVELSIADFVTRGQNPLESTFDLSRCGDAATYLSISTGYRREATKSANPSKWEVFITPKFLIEAHKTSTASHYAAISNAEWTAPFAVIQNYGGWNDVNWYWYHTTLTHRELNTKNLYEICHVSTPARVRFHGRTTALFLDCMWFYLQF